MSVPKLIILDSFYNNANFIWLGLYNTYRACGGKTSNLHSLIVDYKNCEELYHRGLKTEEVFAAFSFDRNDFMTRWALPGVDFDKDDLISYKSMCGFDFTYKITLHNYAEYATFEKVCKNL